MRVIIYRIIPKDALSSYLHEGTRISTNSEEGGGWSIIIQFLPTDGIFDISLLGIILYVVLCVK